MYPFPARRAGMFAVVVCFDDVVVLPTSILDP